jgi:hypothetical protein
MAREFRRIPWIVRVADFVTSIVRPTQRPTWLKAIADRVLAGDRERRITPGQWLAAACVLHGAVLGVAWWHASSHLLLSGRPGGRVVALGRLAGLLLGSAVLLQLVLVGRLPWLEPSLGSDRLYWWHRRLGFTIGSLFLAHPVLLTVGYARRNHLGAVQQFSEFISDWPTRLACGLHHHRARRAVIDATDQAPPDLRDMARQSSHPVRQCGMTGPLS